VKTGTYNEQVTIPTILGASSVNTVTFKSQTNNRNDVVLAWNSTVGNTSTVDVNGNYIVFRHMTLRQTAPSVSAYTVRLGSTASFDTFDQCRIVSPRFAKVSG
jgi:hypothetical protein